MDKIEKALRKLDAKEKEIVKDILDKLEKNNLLGANIQKLKGREDIFRIRKSNIRIIYQKTEAKKIFVLTVERRSEKIYKNI